jgi:hypothetical protein
MSAGTQTEPARFAPRTERRERDAEAHAVNDLLVSGPHGKRVRLLACPVGWCPVEFDRTERVADHIASHDPEDFGLAPEGERSGGETA